MSDVQTKPVRVAVIGTGRMGGALARRLAAAGHEVRVGSRDAERGRLKAEEVGASFGGTYGPAAANADVVILAVPWTAVPDTIEALGDLDGIVLVDVTNPFDEASSASGAEQIQALAPSTRVVKAWNHLYSAVVRRGADFHGVAATVFVAGDDPQAKELVAGLVRDTGFEPADAGPLSSARHLEPLAGLMTTLDRLSDGDVFHGLKLLRRERRAAASGIPARAAPAKGS